MKHLESLQKAVDDAGFLVEDLTETNNGSTDLEHIILIDLIEKAVKLQDKIILLNNIFRNKTE